MIFTPISVQQFKQKKRSTLTIQAHQTKNHFESFTPRIIQFQTNDKRSITQNSPNTKRNNLRVTSTIGMVSKQNPIIPPIQMQCVVGKSLHAEKRIKYKHHVFKELDFQKQPLDEYLIPFLDSFKQSTFQLFSGLPTTRVLKKNRLQTLSQTNPARFEFFNQTSRVTKNNQENHSKEHSELVKLEEKLEKLQSKALQIRFKVNPRFKPYIEQEEKKEQVNLKLLQQTQPIKLSKLQQLDIPLQSPKSQGMRKYTDRKKCLSDVQETPIIKTNQFDIKCWDIDDDSDHF